MKTSLITPFIAIILAFPSISFAKDAQVVGMPAPADHKSYYGTPTVGVKLLKIDNRDQILQELSQRVINLQKLRNREGLSPEYTRESRIYERVLRRVGNTGLTHYRAPKERASRQVWRNGELISVPRLTPAGIHEIVDEYEYERAVRTTPDDMCKQYSGIRQSICRYQQRVDERNRT